MCRLKCATSSIVPCAKLTSSEVSETHFIIPNVKYRSGNKRSCRIGASTSQCYSYTRGRDSAPGHLQQNHVHFKPPPNTANTWLLVANANARAFGAAALPPNGFGVALHGAFSSDATRYVTSTDTSGVGDLATTARTSASRSGAGGAAVVYHLREARGLEELAILPPPPPPPPPGRSNNNTLTINNNTR